MNSKADQLITIIKDIDEQGEFPQDEKVKEFWSKYRDLKYTVPTSIEIRPNLLAKIPGNVITMKTPSTRTFVKVYDEKDMDLTKQVKVGDKLIKTIFECSENKCFGCSNQKSWLCNLEKECRNG